LLKDGHIVQQGTPAELYSKPVYASVASFLGDVNSVKGTLIDGIIQTELGQVPHADAIASDEDRDILIRPEAIRLSPVRNEGEPVAQVEASRNLGPYSLIDLLLPSGASVTARAATVLTPKDGEQCAISLDRKQVFLFPSD
jgi:iron(III) transport system ATP-binding protein